MSRYVIALDQGTTSSRAIILTAAERSFLFPNIPSHRFFPSRDGWNTTP